MPLTRRGRLGIALIVLVVVLGGAAIAGRTLWNTARKNFVSDSCSLGSVELDPGQASVAAQMIGAVTRYRIALPVRAQVLVIAAALQESKLRNIAPGDGDRDSVGVLQQRPSQGWGGGDAQKLTDVGEATKEFLDALMKVDGWQTLPVADAIQEVQVSADGSLYAQHEDEATEIAAVLSGRTPAGITCDISEPTQAAPAATVAAQMREQMGIDTATAPNTRTVRVPGAGWQSVAWLVANADRLGVDRVSYAGRQWTRSDGWQRATASSAAVVATMASV